VLIACGSAAPAAPAAPALPEEVPQEAPQALSSPPTAVPAPAEQPPASTGVEDTLVFVMAGEPGSINPWDPTCNATLLTAVCNEIVNEPLTWITSDTFQVVGLSGLDSWQQLDANTWEFQLREGVKFHNGEPWNAETVKAGIDQNGEPTNASQSFSYHGAIHAEVVDEYTVRVVCAVECPILPRSMIFSRFQAPEWYAAASDDERGVQINSIGPYRLVEWQPGIDIRMEIYEDYVPNPDSSIVDGQAPHIQNLTNLWRSEQLVRVAMVETGEADWAADIGFENKAIMPQWKQSSTSEVFALILDTMWHPELTKRDVREALNLAIDCQAITDALLDGLPCWGNISPPGTIGLNEGNSAPYPYDPARARELLQEANYDPANKITIHTHTGYCCRNLEFQEAVIQYWTEAGINAELQIVDTTRQKDVTSSGCGRYANESGYQGVWDCAERGPAGPNFASPNATVTNTSNEMLDTQVQAGRRVGCLNTSSFACFPDQWEKIMVAMATPTGDLRTERMVEISDFIHDEYLFVPFIAVELVYGLAENLDWEPLYAPRLRPNTMKFTR
jgi:peptide/nickel transport system substrate-binding protein